MSDNLQFLSNENELNERRIGLPERRITMPDGRENKVEQRVGLPDRRVDTNDKIVTIITGSGECKGTINLNSAPLKVDRVSDFFIKSDIAFLTLYDTVLMGQAGKAALLNIKDIAVIIPHDNISPRRPELRQDLDVKVRLKLGIGQINGKINLMGETQQVDRVSDLLNYPGKRWLVVYEACFRGKSLLTTIINLDFISSVEG